nr:hypothetical protein [Tanacetum cinerariifolium]
MEVVREYPADERTAAARTGFVGSAGVPGGVAGMSNGLGLCRSWRGGAAVERARGPGVVLKRRVLEQEHVACGFK